MKVNTNKERSFYTQSQQFAARVLFTVWLLASGSPATALATLKRQPAMVPATTTSPGEPSLASVLPTPPPEDNLQLPPDFPGSFWGSSVASTPSIHTALQQRMSQEVAPDKGRDLLRTSPKVSPVGENLPFQARGGESVRFHYQMGQWRAEVSSRIGAFSRRAVLPVVCSSGEDVTSSLEVLSRYPSWQRQRQIHVLARNVCPTLGEVVYVGELGLRGGGEGEASANEAQINATAFATQMFTSLQPLVSQERTGLMLQATPKQPAEQSQPNRKRKASQDLSPYPEAPSPQRASAPHSSIASLRLSTPPAQIRRAATHPGLPGSFIALAAKQDENCEVRRAAIKAWVSQAHDAPNKAPAIISQLTEIAQDAHSDVRKEALKALGSVAAAVPGEAPNIAPTLTKVAKHPSQLGDVRQAAIEALGVVASAASSEAPKIIPELLAFSRDEDKSVRAASIEALESVTTVAPQKATEIIRTMIAAAKDKDTNVRQAAIKALKSVYPTATQDVLNHEIIPTLIEAAEDSARLAAIDALKSVTHFTPEEATEAIHTMIEAARDENEDVQKAALKTLGAVASIAPSAALATIPELIEMAKYPPRNMLALAAVRALFAKAAPKAPSAAEKCIPQLIAYAKSKDKKVCEAVINILATATPTMLSKHPKIIQSLIEATEHSGPSVRPAAIDALGAVAAAAPSKAPIIILKLKEVAEDDLERWHPRSAAIKALVQLAPTATPEVFQNIIQILKGAAEDRDSFVQKYAIEALAQVASALRQDTLGIIPALIKATKDKDQGARQTAIKELVAVASSLSQEASGAISTLIEVIQDQSPLWRVCKVIIQGQEKSVRVAATEALGKVAPAAPGEASNITHSLLIATKDQEGSVRAAAIQALARIASPVPSKTTEIIPVLIAAAQDQEQNVRAAAIEALGVVVPTAPEKAPNILPILIAVAQDQEESVREAATCALAKISIQQLLACYWARTDPSFIPYITIRLLDISPDNPPLQVWESDTPQHQQVILYATAGQRDVWIQPQEVVQCFTRLIRDEASQVEKGLECYKRYLKRAQAPCDLPGPIKAEQGLECHAKYLEMTPTRDPGIPPNVEEVLCSVKQIHKRAGHLKQVMQKRE